MRARWPLALMMVLGLKAPVAAAVCPVPFEPDGRIDLGALAQALALCAEAADGLVTQSVWTEIVDFGRYELVYSEPDATGATHATGFRQTDYLREMTLAKGLIFWLSRLDQRQP